jgi:hypothetical protein
MNKQLIQHAGVAGLILLLATAPARSQENQLPQDAAKLSLSASNRQTREMAGTARSARRRWISHCRIGSGAQGRSWRMAVTFRAENIVAAGLTIDGPSLTRS